MIRDLPREQLFEGPALWCLVLILAPIVQTTPHIRLDLLLRVEDSRLQSPGHVPCIFGHFERLENFLMTKLLSTVLLSLDCRSSDVLGRDVWQSATGFLLLALLLNFKSS